DFTQAVASDLGRMSSAAGAAGLSKEAQAFIRSVMAEKSGKSKDVGAVPLNPNLKDASGVSALMHAARHGDCGIVSSLIQARANIHARDPAQSTAMHYAAHHGQSEAARELLTSGASAFTRNRGGLSPLDIARLRWQPRFPGQGEDWDAPEEFTPESKARADRGRRLL
ncbi:unnamed protein product, partial [Polarella glacialis]